MDIGTRLIIVLVNMCTYVWVCGFVECVLLYYYKILIHVTIIILLEYILFNNNKVNRYSLF